MKKLQLDTRHDEAKYSSYIIGFVLSVVATLIAYFFVVNQLWPKEVLVYVVLGIAVVQLIIQAVFFLHIGRGSHLKAVTFAFAILVILIVVIGSIWIMNNLDYNMMRMSPDEMQLYMKQHEGI
ncbi:cytochrome o ubiquinol oxidase subunit IV [Candidatus Saccharibacteria bacterium]|nr:cytochrome o ubiquinol oxidase subunit IV [Candidatus Saccharibacteria bacterium]